ncbi:uracil-DNA glycosylase [Candidatus Peribacteria bacterium]|nr:uracil-DNA glycosylase [Candidatus Peribacteria bacterium]
MPLSLPPSWAVALQPYDLPQLLAPIEHFLIAEKAAGRAYQPEGETIFRALHMTPFSAVKVVLLGQDPYPTPGKATGLCFSMPRSYPLITSLKNIYTEIARDTGAALPPHGDLTSWAEQGVLLLNTALTVQLQQPLSHSVIWQPFTDACIRALSTQREHLVFLLWGSSAQRKASLIDPEQHLILRAVHPSPLSAHRGFFGCGHFSACNRYLLRCGQDPIHWGYAPSSPDLQQPALPL